MVKERAASALAHVPPHRKQRFQLRVGSDRPTEGRHEDHAGLNRSLKTLRSCVDPPDLDFDFDPQIEPQDDDYEAN